MKNYFKKTLKKTKKNIKKHVKSLDKGIFPYILYIYKTSLNGKERERKMKNTDQRERLNNLEMLRRRYVEEAEMKLRFAIKKAKEGLEFAIGQSKNAEIHFQRRIDGLNKEEGLELYSFTSSSSEIDDLIHWLESAKRDIAIATKEYEESTVCVSKVKLIDAVLEAQEKDKAS